jgi:hypothetical protein
MLLLSEPTFLLEVDPDAPASDFTFSVFVFARLQSSVPGFLAGASVALEDEAALAVFCFFASSVEVITVEDFVVDAAEKGISFAEIFPASWFTVRACPGDIELTHLDGGADNFAQGNGEIVAFREIQLTNPVGGVTHQAPILGSIVS